MEKGVEKGVDLFFYSKSGQWVRIRSQKINPFWPQAVSAKNDIHTLLAFFSVQCGFGYFSLFSRTFH